MSKGSWFVFCRSSATFFETYLLESFEEVFHFSNLKTCFLLNSKDCVSNLTRGAELRHLCLSSFSSNSFSLSLPQMFLSTTVVMVFEKNSYLAIILTTAQSSLETAFFLPIIIFQNSSSGSFLACFLERVPPVVV